MKLTSMLTNCISVSHVIKFSVMLSLMSKRVQSRSDPLLHSSVESSSLASNNNIKKIQYARRRKIGVDFTNTDKANWKEFVNE